jgi:serine phosphatase RsbU (regulator of sigma subunit)
MSGTLKHSQPDSCAISVLARDSQLEAGWISDLKTLQRGVGNALGNEVHSFRNQVSPIVLVDAKKAGWQSIIGDLDRDGKSVILVIEEREFFPNAEDLHQVDDVLVYPFRLAEVLSKYRGHHERVFQQELLVEVDQAHEDLKSANEVLERIVQAKTPKRFTGIKGVNIMSRHLSGLKPGGDYFDVFESERKDFVNILLCDSSSYGLSSAVLGMMLSSAARIANDAQMNTADWIRAIYQELKVTLGEKEHLSIFFGRINRRDFSLHYQLFGTIEAFVVEKEGECHSLEKHGRRISAMSAPEEGFEKIIHLNPKDRIVLLSDGFVNGVGGEFYLQKIFHQKLEQEPFHLVNELSYQIKSKLIPGETFPGEDCSAIVIDVENRVLRLAPTG